MKYIALLLIIITLATTAFGLYIYLNTKLDVVSVNVVSTDAKNMSNKFFADRQAMQDDTFVGKIFSKDIANGNDYYYIDYNMELCNNLLVDVESLELEAIYKNGDVYQTLDKPLAIIKSKQKASLKASLLSKKTTMGIREFIVHYYVWGIPFKLSYTFK